MTGGVANRWPCVIMFAPTWLKVLTTFAPGSHDATVSPADVVNPRSSPSAPSVIASGFKVSTTILPVRSPSDFTVPSAVFHGNARTTTSPCRAASADGAAVAPICAHRLLGSGLLTSRTPKMMA